MVKEELVTFINNYLKPLGFHKKGITWYKETPETIIVFNLQRSQWSPLYYVNLSVNFRGLSEDKRPKSYQCHASLRAESIGEETKEYLDLEKNMTESDRIKRIIQLLNKSLPILKKYETVAGFKELLGQIYPRSFMLDLVAQEYLGIKVE